MSWRDELQKASFRGVEFGVTRAADTLGRRVVVHEFPQRDVPFAEDTGRKPRAIAVTGFVVGQDFMTRRARLEDALNKPGSGMLAHPWYGEVLAVCTSAQVEHTADEGGMAVFTMTFVAVEAANAPTAGADSRLVTQSRAQLAGKAAANLLQQSVALVGLGQYVLNNTQDVLLKGLAYIGGQLGLDPASIAPWAGQLASNALLLYDMVADGLFGDQVAGLISGMARAASSTPGRLLSAAAHVPAVSVPSVAGVAAMTSARNAAALALAQKSMLTAEALNAAAVYVPPTVADAQNLRGGIVSAVDAVLDQTPDTPDGGAQYDAFVALRASALQAVAVNAGRAPELVTVRPRAVLPSLTLAWRTAADPTRKLAELAEDAVRRNSVRHPGFMPAGRPVDVLREARNAG